jgi:uncharacterized protein DUF6968
MASTLGKIIATREFSAKRPTGTVRVLVRIGWPRRRPTGEWACPFQVTGLGRQKIKQAFGIDAFQAVQLVFQAIRLELESKKHKVTSHGLGLETVLPRPIPAFGDEVFTRRLNKLLEREMLRYVRTARRRLAAKRK